MTAYNAYKRKSTADKIEQGIMNCVEVLELGRMPSRSELESFYGNTEITNRISKGLGYRGWATRLDLSIKDCETSFGQKYEGVVQDILTDLGYLAERMTTKEHFDILVNGLVKIDVKVGRRWYLNKYQANTFGINKKYATCDIYICVALDNNDDIDRILIIPSYLLRNFSTMTIGKNSKYDKWINRFDLIEQYSNFLAALTYE